MSTTQWIFSLTLLTWALARNLGTRPVTRTTFMLPVAIVVAGSCFVLPVPTGGNDLGLIAALGAVGVVLGLAAGAVTRLHERNGQLVATAGAGYAVLWILAVGGRIAFAQWANGTGGRTTGAFSRHHAITGSDAWTAAFVVLALAMVLSRTALLALRTRRPAVGAHAEGAGALQVAS